MEISEILKKHCKGKYVVVINIDDDNPIKEFRFKNLYDAINYASQLSFEDCEKEKIIAKLEERIYCEVAENVIRYCINIVLREDFWMNNWVINEEATPAICFFTIEKP